ncbi:MAG: penicillin-binding transpeptidase domain-containing protein, partial [Gammaproteobacteria bacterium]
SPFEVAGMYQTIASGGFGTPLGAIREVLDNAGKPLSRVPVEVEQKLQPQAVYLLEFALREVLRDGTATAVYRHLPGWLIAAGKTGTTDDLRDSWFAGYTGDLLAVAWIGRDDNGVTGLTGASGALRVWSRMMAEVSRVPLRPRAPEGVVEQWVDTAGGGLSAPGCPGAREVPFLAGTSPAYAASCGPRAGAVEAPSGRMPAPAPRSPGKERQKPAEPDRETERSWWERLFGQ